MEVIKHGNTYREKECQECGALLSYCLSEIIKESDWDEYFGEWHGFYKEYIVCPECKKEIIFSYIIDDEVKVK